MKLNVELRNIKGKKVRKLRREDKVPAVVYATHLEKPISILCDRNEFVKLYRQTGYSTPITLTGEGVDELVLIQDIQLDPVTDKAIHIDFLGIKKGVKVSAEVAIVMIGDEESPLVKSGEANFELLKDYLMINALPKDLVKEITVDVSGVTD
ncbi:MAG TPA: 50S ribosomal protein L25, partial [Candidatus Absconditabacterales bacterium]|nr:50S ribosomal protein L25 [Candidatus Absconditabacterales bacterium]